MGLGPTEKYHKELHPLFEKGSLTCLDAEIIRSRASNLGPLVLNIEPTNMCNLNCSYCPSSKMRAKLGTYYLPVDFIEKTLVSDKDLALSRLLWINFHKDGEPLMHPELEKIINIAHYTFPNAFTHLNTNGLMLTPSIGKSLLDSRIDDVTVSIDAAWEETYNKQKGLDPNHRLFDALKRNVKAFIEERNRMAWQKIIDGKPTYDTKIRVKMIEFSDTDSREIEDFEAEWLLHTDVQITGAHDWGGGVDVDITDQTKPDRHACPLLWYALAINSDQTVSICNVDWDRSGQLGSLQRNTLQEIWQGPRLSEIRRLHLYKYWNSPRMPGVCKNCVVWAGCKNMDEIFKGRVSML